MKKKFVKVMAAMTVAVLIVGNTNDVVFPSFETLDNMLSHHHSGEAHICPYKYLNGCHPLLFYLPLYYLLSKLHALGRQCRKNIRDQPGKPSRGNWQVILLKRILSN